MRKFISKKLKNCFFISCDLWNLEKFQLNKSVKHIECYLSESNVWNIASGISMSGSDVFVYGVAGFLIHRYEALRTSISKSRDLLKGKITILNAGKVGYSDYFHQLWDDLELMKLLEIPVFEPETIQELEETLNNLEKIKYIRLYKDFYP